MVFYRTLKEGSVDFLFFFWDFGHIWTLLNIYGAFFKGSIKYPFLECGYPIYFASCLSINNRNVSIRTHCHRLYMIYSYFISIMTPVENLCLTFFLLKFIPEDTKLQGLSYVRFNFLWQLCTRELGPKYRQNDFSQPCIPLSCEKKIYKRKLF